MTIVSRISTNAIFRNTLSDVNSTQAHLADLQGQLSSGLKTNKFSGLSGHVEQFTFLEAKIKKTQNYEDNNANNIARLQSTNVSITQLINAADTLEDLFVARRNPASAQDLNFEQQVKIKIDSIASELNSTFEGKFIFGGTKSNVKPVKDDPSVPAPVTLGTLDDGYYQGSKENQTARASDSVDFELGVRADDTAFQKLIHSAYLAIEGHKTNNDTTISQAIDLIQSGIQDIISRQSDVNTDIIRLQDINERHLALRTYWKGVTEDLSKTDILSVSTQVSVDQTVLQSTFQAFSKINNLRLVDFLR